MGALQSRRSRDPKNKPRTSLHRPYVANASVASNQRHSQVTETDSLSKQEGRRERERECVRMERRSSVRRDMERPLTNFGRHSGSGDVTTKQVVCLSSLLFNMRRSFCIWVYDADQESNKAKQIASHSNKQFAGNIATRLTRWRQRRFPMA